jgi:hypothetical protein
MNRKFRRSNSLPLLLRLAFSFLVAASLPKMPATLIKIIHLPVQFEKISVFAVFAELHCAFVLFHA